MALNQNTAILAFLDANYEGNDTAIEELVESGNVNYQLPTKLTCNSVPEDLESASALHIAAQNQDLNRIKKLLKNSADLTLKDYQGMTALHRAVECERNSIHPYIYKLRGQLKDETINLLLSAQLASNVIENPRSKNGISHFHAACITNNVQALEFFLKNGSSVDEAVNKNSSILPSYTPLHFVARYSSAESAKILLDHGAQPHMKDAQGLTPLQILIQRNMEIADWKNMGERVRYGQLQDEYERNEIIIEAILEKTSEEFIDDTGLTRLHVACTLKDTSILEKVLAETTDIEQSVKETSSLWPGFTALHFAAHFNVQAVKLLINRGANMLIKAANHITPFDLCLQRYRPETLHDLINTHSDWKDIQFSDGQTKLLDFIYSMRNRNAFEQFVDVKLSNINTFIPHDSPIFPGYTPLHILTVAHEKFGDIDDVIKDTLYKLQDNYGYLHSCKESEESRLYAARISICLDKRPDLNVRNYYKSTTLHLAFKLHRPSIVDAYQNKYSFQTKSIENYIDDDGLSHFQIACASGDQNLVEALFCKNKKHCLENSSLRKDYEYIRKTHRYGQNFPVVFKKGSTPLHIAAVIRNFKMVKYFLICGYDVHAQDAEKMTPIHRSIVFPKICNYLLNWAIKNLRNHVANCGLSHLHVACAVKNVEAAAVLIRNGANINETVLMDYEDDKTLRGLSPLQIAVRVRSREIVKLLIRAGAKIVVEPHYFFDQRYEDCTDLFERHVAKDKPVDEVQNLTELHVACYVINFNRVRKLLEEGADSNARIHSSHPVWANYTPLHLLASVYRYHRDTIDAVNSIIKILIEYGADIMLTNNDNETPLHKAFYKICQVADANTSEKDQIPKRVDALLKMQPADLETQLRHGWNDNDRSPNIYLKEEDPLTFHRINGANSLDGIRGKVGFTKGLHLWEIHCNVKQSGTYVGVATAQIPLHDPDYARVISTNENIYGWDINYMAARVHENTVIVPDKIIVILDMDEGTLSYIVDDMYLGVAYNRLKGKAIYPAVSTTTNDAEVTIKYIGGLENDDLIEDTLQVLLNGHSNFTKNPTDNKGISTFHIACLFNNFPVVKKFLEHGVKVNQSVDHFCGTYAGCTPLHLTTCRKHMETTDLLIKHGADVHARNREGNTPLHCTVDGLNYLLCNRFYQKSKENILFSLVKAGADVKAKNRFDQMPIEILMETEELTSEIVEFFLGNQANVNFFNHFDVGFIANAISYESNIEDILKHPIYAAVVNYPEINGPDNMGRTPIHNIVSYSPYKITTEMYLKLIEGLTKLNFDIDQYDYEGRTPLHSAVKFKNLQAINALLELGSDFNIVDIDGETPYSLAMKLKKQETGEVPNVEFRKIFEVFATHVYKLKFAGLEINEANEETNQIYKNKFCELDDEVYLESLVNVKIGTCEFSLREFLSSNDATALYQNMNKDARESFDEFFQDGNNQCKKDYPEWLGILRMQYRKVRGKTILPTATENTSIFSSLYSYLPWA